AAFLGGFAQPAHGQGQATHGADLDGPLVVAATDATALDLDDGLDVVDREIEHLDRILAGLGLDLVESAIDAALGHSRFAGQHDDVHELRQFDAAELGIRQDFTFGYCATAGHSGFPCDDSVEPINTATAPHQGATYIPRTMPRLHGLAGEPAWRGKNYFLGRLAPYFERACLRSFTPCRSSEPRTM